MLYSLQQLLVSTKEKFVFQAMEKIEQAQVHPYGAVQAIRG
jgi:hypothetical protein